MRVHDDSQQTADAGLHARNTRYWKLELNASLFKCGSTTICKKYPWNECRSQTRVYAVYDNDDMTKNTNEIIVEL